MTGKQLYINYTQRQMCQARALDACQYTETAFLAQLRARSRWLAAISIILILSLQLQSLHASVGATSSLLAAPPPTEFGKKSTPAFKETQVSGTGTFNYSYPLLFPLGRHGITPLLNLQYSSDAPIRGGLAAGWSLGIPAIKGDTTQGSLDPSGNNPAESNFVSNFMGGGKLVKQSDSPAAQNGVDVYYALHDNQYVRYERTNAVSSLTPYWRARTADGHVYEFGNPLYHEPYDARLYRQIDPFGHVIKYKWELESFYTADGTSYEPVLTGIYYQSHVGADPYAAITLEYSEQICSSGAGFPVGAKLDYLLKDHSGTPRLSGSQQLNAIIIQARRPTANASGGMDLGTELTDVRRYDLQYSEETAACDYNLGAPLRRLESIRETAYAPVTGTASTMPPTQFFYGEFAPAQNMRYERTAFNELTLPDGKDQVHWGEGLPGVATVLADLNGDGLQDMLRRLVESTDTDNRATVFYNTGNGFSSQGVTVNFPEWLPDNVPDPDEPLYQNKSLGLAGQLKFYADHSDAWVNNACDADISNRNGSLEKFGLFDANHDGLPDLVTALHYDPVRVTDRYLPSLPSAGQQTQQAKALAIPDDPEPNICGLGIVRKRWPVWKVRYNLGNGFSNAVELMHAPIALAGISAGFSIGSSNPSVIIERDGNGDFNGDGLLDRMHKGYLTPDDEDFHYDAQGFFVPVGDTDELGDRERWITLGQPDGSLYRVTGLHWQLPREWLSNQKEFGSATDPHRYFATTTGLLDVNGDGLDDLVSTNEPAESPNWQFGYYPNTGQSFSENMVTSSNNFSADGVKYYSYSYSQISEKAQGLPSAGVSETQVFPMDINSDGLVDLVKLENTQIKVYANNGYRFAESPAILRLVYDDAGGTMTERLRQSLRSLVYMGLDSPKAWQKYNAFVDMNGDGVKDIVLVENYPNTSHQLYTATQEHPPYRMQAIVKGTGVVTRIDYASSADAATVEQGDYDGGYYTLRQPKWLVRSITAQPGGQPALQTDYYYRYPVYNADLFGNFALRGFREIVKRAPSGSETHTRYDFSAHYAGLITEEITYASESPDIPYQVISNEYDPLPALHDTDNAMLEAPQNWHTVVKTTYRCPATQPPGEDGAAYCKSQGEDLRNVSVWISLDYEGDGVAAGVPATRVIAAQYTSYNEEGVRRDIRSPKQFAIRADADEYVVRTTLDTTRDYTNYPSNGDPRAFNQKIYRWSDDLLTLIIDKENIFEWDDTAKTNVRITNKYARHTYDERGLLINSLSPREYPGGVDGRTGTDFEYDDAGVTLTKTTNSLGHVLQGVIDIGTGATLLAEGPNITINANGDRVWERNRIVVDGWGRPLENYVSVDDAVAGYREVLVERTSYDDAPTYHPKSYGTAVTVERLVADARFNATFTVYDGLGRERYQRIDSEETAASETHYHWDSAGNMTRIDLPDPGIEGGQVSYQYAYDSLGRATQTSGPDGALLSATRYEGLTAIISERGEAEAPAAEKRVTTNMALQLVKVEEKLNNGSYAETQYRYDAGGNVSEITDPEGIVTRLTHDSAGRRINIASGGKTWAYAYDLNDNLIAEISPHPAGTAEAYTTRFEYDILDRMTRRIPAKADLSDDELAAFGWGETLYVYDQPHPSMGETTLNYVGRLGYRASPIVANLFRYDAQGSVIEHRQQLNIEGFGAAGKDELVKTASYYSDGEIATASLRAPASGRSLVDGLTVSYDSRGMPERLEAHVELAQLVRNHAGLVTQRLSFHSGNTVSSNYDYDAYGRIRELTVYDAASAGEPYRQRFNYFANSLVKSVQETPFDGIQRDMRYSWDSRHQIVHAEQAGSPGYAAQFAYDRAGRLSAAAVGLNSKHPQELKHTRVPQRDVTYVYDSDDPQRLEKLVNQDGKSYAAYTHDLAGNMIQRTLDGETWTLRYDGENRLRHVTHARNGKQLGSETYFYDGNTRILALTADGALRRWFDAAEVHYFQGAHVKDWYYADLGQTIARIENGDAVEYRFQTPQGHEALSLKPDGTVQAGKLYGPFGEVLYAKLAKDVNPSDYTREFNGKDYDAVSGLHYYGYRYYDPVALLWNRADPKYRFAPEQGFDEPRRMNLYTFALNNPVTLVDPDGQDAVDTISMAIYDVKERVYKNPNRAIRQLPKHIRKQITGRARMYVMEQIKNQAGYDRATRYSRYIDEAESVAGYTNPKKRKHIKRRGEKRLTKISKKYAAFHLFHTAVNDALTMVKELLEDIRQELKSIDENGSDVSDKYLKDLKKQRKQLKKDEKALDALYHDLFNELGDQEKAFKDLFEAGNLWLDDKTDRKRL